MRTPLRVAVAILIFVLFVTISPTYGELTPEQTKQAQTLIAQFASPGFAVRQQAVEELIKMGQDVLPLLRKTLADSRDEEVKLRCQMVIKAIAEKQAEVEAETRKRQAQLEAEEKRRQAEAELKKPGPELKKRSEAKLAELRKQGEPLTYGELMPPEIPDAENAAVLYQKAFDEYDRLAQPVKERASRLYGRRPFTPVELEEARGLMEPTAELRKLLHQAALRQRCRFPMEGDVNAFSEAHLPFWSKFQAMARVQNFWAKVNTATGRPDEAMKDYVSQLRLGRALDDEPMLLSGLVGIAVSALARVELTRVLDETEPSAESLQRALDALGDVSDRSRFVGMFKRERCFVITKFQEMLPDPAAPEAPLIYSQGIAFLDEMDRCLELVGKSWHQSKVDWKAFEDRLADEDLEKPLVAPLIRVLAKVALSYDRMVATNGVSKLAVALRLYRLKHGAYPDKLAVLVPEFLKKLPTDPFSGKEYVYRREGKGFVVYSIGDDGVDDGGKETRGCTPDIAFRCSR